MAQAIERTRAAATRDRVAHAIDRSLVDRLISWAGLMLAVALVALGGAAIYGGNFALDNVRDRLEPQKISFPAASEMTPEEKAEVGSFAGEEVDTGTEAEAYSRYIGLHVSEIGGGKTYAELGPVQFGLEAQIEEAKANNDPNVADLEEQYAAVSGQRDTIFKGETLKSILLNAYGWWTVGQITLYAGIGMVVAGLILALLVAFGFRHARKAAASVA